RAQYAELMDNAKAAVRRHRYDAAIEAVEAALRLFPDDREAKEELHKLKQAKKDSRTEFNKLMVRGNAALQNQQVEEAARAFSAAAALAPDDSTAARMVKQVDQMLGNVNSAQATYLRSVTRGALALQTGLYADAVAAFTQALQIAPNDPESLVG